MKTSNLTYYVCSATAAKGYLFDNKAFTTTKRIPKLDINMSLIYNLYNDSYMLAYGGYLVVLIFLRVYTH